jgi:hypothetical protein
LDLSRGLELSTILEAGRANVARRTASREGAGLGELAEADGLI